METLTNEQLCVLAQAGDRQVVSRLIETNLPFIRQTANRVIGNSTRESFLSSCGIGMDDLIQAGSIGLWKAVAGYDHSSGNKFLTYAAPAIRRAMADLIDRCSRKDASIEVISLDDLRNNVDKNLMASPGQTQPEHILIGQERTAELLEAMDALPGREDTYVQYRFGFTDGVAHPLTETAQYFRLSESRAKGVERSALKLLKHELLMEIPERAYVRAENKLTKRLVAEGELHAVELRLKSQQKRGRKIAAAVYDYLADCDGKWGELRYNFKDDTAEVLLLADWDTMVSRRFAMRAIEHLREHRNEKLPDKIVLTFIGPEQIRVRASNCRLKKLRKM